MYNAKEILLKLFLGVLSKILGVLSKFATKKSTAPPIFFRSKKCYVHPDSNILNCRPAGCRILSYLNFEKSIFFTFETDRSCTVKYLSSRSLVQQSFWDFRGYSVEELLIWLSFQGLHHSKSFDILWAGYDIASAIGCMLWLSTDMIISKEFYFSTN